MDKAIVAGMLVSAAISVVMIGIVSLVPSIGSSSQAISEAYNEITDRRLVAIEVLAVNQQSELMEAWVKNVGTTTIDAIDKMDVFLERVDGPGIERVSYYPGTGDPHKTWSGDLWEQGIPWAPKTTMHITVGLSAEQLFITCENYSFIFLSTVIVTSAEKTFRASVPPPVALTYNPNRAVSSADTLTITATFVTQITETTPTISIVDSVGATIQSSTNMTDSGNQSVWTFDFPVPTSNDGTATVTVTDARDCWGNVNAAATNNTFTIDNAPPSTVLSYDIGRAVSSADTLTITATFVEGMNQFPQLSIVNATGDTIQTAANMTGNTGDTVWTFSYSIPAGNTGTATVTVQGTDIAGNANLPASNTQFTIDNLKPEVALTYDINRAVSSADTLAITATFGEAMQASPTIAIVNGTGGSIQAATAMTGNSGDTVWTFSFAIPNGNSGDATVFIDGLDFAGNGNQAPSNDNFTIDNLKPAVGLTYSPNRPVSSADTLAITATSGQGIQASPTIAIQNATGDFIQAATSMTGSAGDTIWTFNFTVPAGNSGDATVFIDGLDIAGNGNQTPSNNTFTIDNKKPTVALTYNPDRALSSADTVTITATFGQGMDASPQISIVNATGDTIQAATNLTGSAGDTVWTFNFTVPDGNDGTATVTIDGQDPAGNGNETASNNTFVIDNVEPPVALTYSPNRAVSSADTLTITATFSEGMRESPQVSIVNATGDSIQAATAMTGNTGDTVWTFNFSVPAGNSGDATVTVAGLDLAGNTSETATNNTFTIDNKKPIVALTYSPARKVSSADTLAVTATFTEGMSASPQISIVNSGAATIQAATSMTGAAGDTVWTFNFSVPDGNEGTATITIVGTDIAGNSNEAASNTTFVIDNTEPTVALTYNHARAVSSADTLAITADFSENIVSSTPQITIVDAGSSTIQATTNMTGSSGDTTWTFSFNVPDGSDGAATVIIADGKDEAGNSNETASNNTFTIDNTGPTVALSYNPARAVSSADTLAITADFNENIVSSTPQITILDAASSTIQATTSMTGSSGDTTWTFSFNVPDGSDGAATVIIADGKDQAGNSNQTASNNTFTIDNTGPTVAISYGPNRAVSSADTLAITADFNESIVSSTPQITIVNATGDTLQAATNMTGSSGDTAWTFSYSVPDGNSGDATVTITGGKDQAGNSNQAASNNTFTIDNKKPVVAITYSPDRVVSSADTLAITATFSQGMRASLQISIVNSTGDSIQAATNMTGNAGDTVWTFDFSVPADNDGVATVTITGTDIAGNSNEAASNNTFTIDNTKPTVALTYNPARAVSSADTLTITATFDQAINGTPNIAIDTQGTDLSSTAMTDSGNQITWTYSYSVPSGSDGTATVIVSGATDDAGNPNDSPTNNTFTIDNTGPTVALTYGPNRAVSSADTLAITADFNEGIISSTPQITIVNATGDTIQATTNMTGSSGDTTWTFSFSVPDGNSGDATVTISGGKDQAGNSNQTASNDTFTIDNLKPEVALTYDLNRAVSSADTLEITATFGQGMRASPTIAIENATGDSIQAATAMTGNAGDTVWTFSFSVPAGNSGDATVFIDGLDIAGNGNQTPSNDNFTIDNLKPEVALTYDISRAVSSADTLEITATFGQGMSASPQISIVNATGDSIQAATAMTGNAGDTVWTFNFAIPDGNSGDATIFIDGLDIAGNGNQAASNDNFTIDNLKPEVALTYDISRAVSSADTLAITATFGQGMRASPQISIVNATGDSVQAATAMTGNAGDTVWTFNFTVPDGNSGDATVFIDGLDIAGNGNQAASNNTFTIDNLKPAVALTYSPNRTVSSADTLAITATFGQGMRASPTIVIQNTTGDTIQAATAMTGNAGATVWTFNFTVPDGNSGDATVFINGLDIAGNGNQTPSNNTFTIDNSKPVLASAAVNDTTLVLTYTEANGLDTGSTPATGDFTVLVNGGNQDIASVTVDTNTVTLTLTGQGADNGDAVTVSYTPGVNPIEDLAGNQAADLVNQVVTNNTP